MDTKKTIIAAPLICLLAAQADAAITVTKTATLQFGTMEDPTSGSPTRIVSTAGAGSGTGIYLYGTTDAGGYTIKCTGGKCRNHQVDVINVAPNCTGVTLGTLRGSYNGAASAAMPITFTLNNNATATFDFGATATYTSSVSPGQCAPSFQVRVRDNGGTVQGTLNDTGVIGFDKTLTLTKNNDINFGKVTASNASTYRISTSGTVTTVSGTGQPLSAASATTAGQITISGSATQGITISAGSFVANNGVTLSNPTCSYNGAASVACSSAISVSAPNTGTILLLGIDAASNGTRGVGQTAAPSMTVTVNYQ